MRRYLLFLTLIYCSLATADAQVVTKPGNLNFFLECNDCDFDFVRQNLGFISFVRDPKLADVHILSSESPTGSGGKKYFINFIGLNDFSGRNLEYIYIAGQSETHDETRSGLLKLIQAGILHYYAYAGNLTVFDISMASSGKQVISETLEDPWKNWIFRLEAGGYLQKESSQNEYSLNTEFEVEKVTSDWKTEFEAEHDIDLENYFDEGLRITNRQVRTSINAEYIKSLTPRWSAGVFSGYSSDTYVNRQHEYSFNAGIEYNIFPWDISNRKVFTFGYAAGVSRLDYFEETIYDLLHQTAFHESLELDLMMVQPWGTVESRLEGRHYFHDFSKNRLVFESQISVRITKQLAVYSQVEYQVVRDQIYLPKGKASLEDVLLRRRKMATDYELWMELGISFTFGSIYNNVVNERM